MADYIDRISINKGTPHILLGQDIDEGYGGVNLAVKFADEIANYNNDPAAWIRARIRANNYSGLHIADYIPITTTNNYTLNAQIGGIDTYYQYGDTAVGHHIDFICRHCWNKEYIQWNLKNYNNGYIPVDTLNGDGSTTAFVLPHEPDSITEVKVAGTVTTEYTYDPETYTITFSTAPAAGTGNIVVTGNGDDSPWLSSNAYKYANSLKGIVPNGTGVNPLPAHVDYTNGGIYYYFPDNWKAVIIEKRMYIGTRHTTTELLTDDNAGEWRNIGKIWFPTETEIHGMTHWGSGHYGSMGSIQYPIFRTKKFQMKGKDSGRSAWWSSSAFSGLTTSACSVYTNGFASAYYTSSSYGAPVCFRVS